MSNLVPEKRQDKNGRLVTRHVKAAQAGKATNMPLPVTAVPLAKVSSHPEAAERILETLLTPSASEPGFYETHSGGTIEFSHINMLLSKMDPEVLDLISDHAEQLSGAERSVMSATFSEITMRFAGLMHRTDLVENMLHYSAGLAPDLVKYSSDNDNAMEMHNEAMHIMAQVELRFKGADGKLLTNSEGEKAVVRGLAVKYLLTGNYSEKTNIQDLDWIGRNLDLIEPYKEVIRSHGAMDRNVVEGLLESETPSLAGGYL